MSDWKELEKFNIVGVGLKQNKAILAKLRELDYRYIGGERPDPDEVWYTASTKDDDDKTTRVTNYCISPLRKSISFNNCMSMIKHKMDNTPWVSFEEFMDMTELEDETGE